MFYVLCSLFSVPIVPQESEIRTNNLDLHHAVEYDREEYERQSPMITIHVSLKTRNLLDQLVRDSGLSMQEVVDQALELYRRQQILAQTDMAYRALRADPEAWQAFRTEQIEWDTTLSDGLENY